MDNKKYFNIYVFLSSFARNLIEIFIGTILYKAGFSLKEVIFYFLIVNVVSLLIVPIFIKISKKYSGIGLSVIGIIAFTILQILLNSIQLNIYYLFILATLYAVYRKAYWIPRRFYSLKVVKKENIANTYSVISIVTQIATIIASYIGAISLDFIGINVLTAISISLFLLSLYPLKKLKFHHERNSEDLNLLKTIKDVGVGNLFLFGTYELLTVVRFLFPLYIFIYVENTYQTIGILALISNIATILFSYIYGRFINNEKNFLKSSILLMFLVYVFKLNFTGITLCIISFIEGLVAKMNEISHNKNFFMLSKQYEYYNYNYAYEVAQSIFRTLSVLIMVLFFDNLKYMIYFSLLCVFSGIFVNFKINTIDTGKES